MPDQPGRAAEELVAAVTTHVERTLERCGDRHSGMGTPMLVDGIDLDTDEPARWEGHVLTNPARQQNFARTLVGLSALSGDSKYLTRAREWMTHALRVLSDPASGMLFWGGHSSYDLEADAPLLGNHELKCSYPYFPFMYDVDPETAKRFVDGFWHRHMNDWSNLLFNRHGEYEDWDRATRWSHQYEGGPLPIIENVCLSFINTGSDLACAAAHISKLGGEAEPLVWAKRLLNRYDEVRHPETGLGGYQYNHRDPCRVRASFKEPFASRQDINETTVLGGGLIPTRYGRAALTWMNLYEELGSERGGEFLDMVRADLQALAAHAYDETAHQFHAVVVDGTRLSPEDAMEGVGYCPPQKLQPVGADGLMFLSYARAHRMAGVDRFGEMALSLAEGMGWTAAGGPLDPGSTPTPESWEAPAVPGQSESYSLAGLLEMHRATDEDQYLMAATALATRLARQCPVDGILPTGGDSPTYASVDNPLPLALLHVAAAASGSDASIPVLYANNSAFDPKVIIARRERVT